MKRMIIAAIALMAVAGCAGLNAEERALRKHYATNEYPANPVTGLRRVALVVMDASAEGRVDLDALSTAMYTQLQSVKGLEVMPSRVALAAVETGGFILPRDGLKLADALGLDGVFIAIVTEYDPYGEPVIGMALTLFSRAAAPVGKVDLDMIIQGGRPLEMPDSPGTEPVTAVFDVYDAAQATTRKKLEYYAAGQTAEAVGYGWERYYRSMPNFMRFCSYEIVWKLFDTLLVERSAATPAQA